MSTESKCTSLTREELYERVWKTPMRHLAKEFGFSDVGFAKLCKRHDIPTPPLGYWAKLMHGKKVSRPKLPPAENDDSVIDLSREVLAPTAEVPIAETFFDPEIGRLAEEVSKSPPIAVPDSLRSPHEAVVRTKIALEECARSQFHRSGESLRPYGGGGSVFLDVVVGKPLVGRALRICDALLKACEARGFKVGAEKHEWRSERVHIHAFGESFELKVREPTKRTTRELTAHEKERLRANPQAYVSNRFEYNSTGTLRLELCRYSSPFITLQDGKKRRVEDGLNRVIMAILRDVDRHRKFEAEMARQEAEKQERERQKQEREERRRRKELRRKRRQARIDSLVAEANAWRQSQIVRDYVTAAREAVLERDGQIEEGGKIEAWFGWAERVAQSIDPLREIRSPRVKPTPK